MVVCLCKLQTGVGYAPLFFPFWTDGYQHGHDLQFDVHAGQQFAKSCSVVNCLIASDGDNVISHKSFCDVDMLLCPDKGIVDACTISNGFVYMFTYKPVLCS